jgi:uncharacterized protein (TIGR02246 family)
MSQDEQAIRALVATWMEATRRGDTEAVLALIADDVVFMVPGREPFGKDEFKALASGQMEGVRLDATADIVELKVLGDWAYLRNRLTVTVVSGSGEPLFKRSGYTLSILRKEPDGRWLLARDANLMGMARESTQKLHLG